MSKDYRRAGPSRPAPRRKQGRSCLWSFVLGCMLGAFGVSLYWTQDSSDEAISTAGLPPKAERAAPAPPSFEFENLLRETEVDIGRGPPAPPPAPRPEPPAAAEQLPAEPPSVPTSPNGRGFLVQVGSFRRAADAERLKAELALLGISSRVQTARVASGETYHRVRAGPYADRGAVDKVRNLLKKNGKESMVVPIK